MLSVRLDEKVESHLERVARIQGISRSAVVRKALVAYLEKYQRPSAWEIGEELFGRYGSGDKERVTRSKRISKEQVRRKWHG